jgi:phage-related protein
MSWSIEYYSSGVDAFVLDLPPGLLARYLRLTDMMLEFGSNLGVPHTRAMSDGPFELRVKGAEGIARVFYCTLVGQRIVMLHGFVKKSQKTPAKDLKLARQRMIEVKADETY